MSNKKKGIFSLAVMMALVVSMLGISAMASSEEQVTAAEKVTTSAKMRPAGSSTLKINNTLWFKTAYETRKNSESAVFELPNEYTKYYVYICQRIVPRDIWGRRDTHIPDTPYLAFNMLKTGQAEVLGSELLYPWILSRHNFYWLREVDPETGWPYVVYKDGSIGIEEPHNWNTGFVAPAMLVPK